MVLFVSCYSRSSSSLVSTPHPHSSDLLHEVATSQSYVAPRSQPLPLRSPYSYEDSSCAVERYSSSLSSSAESISSIKSNASRSPAEREAERMQRRQLLDSSLNKMRASNNLPLRKHLLIFNTIKQLQRDLDLLDDEDLYCSLIGEECHHMEVDECRWLAPPVVAPAAPPSQEEHHAASIPNNIMAPLNTSAVSITNDDLDMDTSPTSPAINTWSWSRSSSGTGLFESIQDALGGSFSSWRLGTTGSWGSGRSRQDYLWGMDDLSVDPLGGASLSRFELQHLFPSQVLLQA